MQFWARRMVDGHRSRPALLRDHAQWAKVSVVRGSQLHVTVVLDPKTFQVLAFNRETSMNTLFSLAAIGVIIILGVWVGSLTLAVIYFVGAGVWRLVCAVSHLFTRSAIAPQPR